MKGIFVRIPVKRSIGRKRLLMSSGISLAIFERPGALGAALPIRALLPGSAVVGPLRAWCQAALGANED